MISTRLIGYFLVTVGFSNIAIASEQTYVREYTYQASEADSKLTARTIALQEVKRELLSELGTHVTALVKIQSSSDGHTLGEEEIETLSAGVTRVEILDEQWNGVVYVLKAQIKADPEEVLKSLNNMLDADRKQKQISQLSGDLSKMQTENIQIAESLTQSKKETTAALAEMARLRKQLEQQQTVVSRKNLQTAYQHQVDQLTLNEWYETAQKKFREGDYSAAFQLSQKAAQQGHSPSQYALGMMYSNGKGITRDPKQAAFWWKKAADQGHASAQYILGWMYSEGEGVARNIKQAVHWYQKAAEQGNANAQHNLGMRYYKGEGVARDTKQAVFWWKKASEQGYAYSQNNLGAMYAAGTGVARDEKQAVFWFLKAAEQGDPGGQTSLGTMYVNGRGVARDPNQAVAWFQKAADKGYASAQIKLAIQYSEGDGVPHDKKQAAYWIQKAAEQGEAGAQSILAAMYMHGDGVEKDIRQAMYWNDKSNEKRKPN